MIGNLIVWLATVLSLAAWGGLAVTCRIALPSDDQDQP